MKNLFKNYKTTIILLGAIIVGAIIGLVFKEDATILKPLGDVFLNLLLVIIIPLIFFTITTAIAKMKTPKRLGKIIGITFVVFLITSLVAVLIGFGVTYFINLVSVEDGEQIRAELSEDVVVEEQEDMTIAERTVSLITVNDFAKLFTTQNIMAVLVFSIIVGIAINMTGEKGKPVVDFIIAGNEVMQNIMKIIMLYAPIGLAAYFASLIGSFGATIVTGYLKTFIVYTIVSILFFVIVYTIYAFIAGGRRGVVTFWKNVLPATATSVATCSSAASIPVNVDCAKKMGVSEDIAQTVIPLGTSFHKDGSIIGSVFKIMFLVGLFGMSMATFGDVVSILGIALLANLLVAAVPIGGGTISEMLIITMLGAPVAALPILTIIAAIIDPPATMLNVVGDTSASMVVARGVDGKDWMDKQE